MSLERKLISVGIVLSSVIMVAVIFNLMQVSTLSQKIDQLSATIDRMRATVDTMLPKPLILDSGCLLDSGYYVT